MLHKDGGAESQVACTLHPPLPHKTHLKLQTQGGLRQVLCMLFGTDLTVLACLRHYASQLESLLDCLTSPQTLCGSQSSLLELWRNETDCRRICCGSVEFSFEPRVRSVQVGEDMVCARIDDNCAHCTNGSHDPNDGVDECHQQSKPLPAQPRAASGFTHGPREGLYHSMREGVDQMSRVTCHSGEARQLHLADVDEDCTQDIMVQAEEMTLVQRWVG